MSQPTHGSGSQMLVLSNIGMLSRELNKHRICVWTTNQTDNLAEALASLPMIVPESLIDVPFDFWYYITLSP